MRKIYTFVLFTAVLYLEGKSQNVGVGESSPASKLSVKGNLAIGSGYSTTAAPANGLAVEGNVGIGTANPTYKLHTLGDIYANGGWFRVSGNQGLYFESWGGGFYMTDATWIRTFNDKNFYHNTGIMRTDGTFQVGGSGATFNVVNGGDLSYRTNVLIANTAGNVGVGTASPGAKLDIEGGAFLGYETTLTDFGGILKSGFYQDGGSAITGDVPDQTHGWSHLITARHSSTGNNHQLQIAGSYAVNDRLFFRKIATGNNADNPAWNELATRGSNTFTGTQTINGTLGGTVTGQFIQNQFSGAQSSSNFWISGEGRAGGNVFAGAHFVNESADPYFRTNADNKHIVLSGGSGWASSGATMVLRGASAGNNAHGIELYTGNAERVRILSGGNVGIGTASPTSLLQISGAHSTTQMRLTLPAANNGGGTGDVNMQLWVSEPGVTWDAGGIGTNVTNNNGTPSGFGRLNTSLGQSYIRFITNGGAMAFNTTDNSGNYYQTMYMTGGNVGIGYTSPSYKLDVAGSIRSVGGTIIAEQSSNEGGNLALVNPSKSGAITRDWRIWNMTGGYGNGLSFWRYYADGTNAGPSVWFGDNGNVGIGTTGPGEKLHVTSNIRADGIVYWGNGLVRTESRDDAGLRGDAGARSGFFETASPTNYPAGASSWWHLIDTRHSNNGNNYALQIAGSFFDQDLYYRKTNNNPSQAWTKILTSSSSIGQSVGSASSTSETALVSNNSGSFSYTPGGAGWTPGTWQSTGFSVTKTITSGNMVHVTVTARIEGDNYNYYVPSCAYFRLMRGTTELARTAVYLTAASYVPSSFWYYNSNTLSFNYVDTGISGSQSYSIEFWLPNEHSASEVVFLSERIMNVIELKQ